MVVITPMCRLSPLVFVSLLVGAACQRGPGLCPPGMQRDSSHESNAKSVWCRGNAGAQRWIELWGPGDRRQSCGFEKGKAEGQFLAWHKGGKKWLEGQYRAGQKEGRWTQWDKEGHPVADGEYRSGVLIAGAPVGMVALCENQKP
jgi:hypothetical protein